MKNHKKLELLSPAGNLEKLKIALAYGADAVYLGLLQFSLRAKTGFSLADLKTGIKYAHTLRRKVYVTVNIFAHQRHIELLPKFLKDLAKCQPDAVILSDPGVLLLIKKHLPKTPIHLSTQANTLNSEAVKFWQKNGVKRIILGREASLADIKKIHQVVPKMELEVFVHGAMCLSYSGRCYLSSWLNSRSANLGLCTQPCRWDYKVFMEEPKRPGMMIPVESDQNGTYIMNSKDLRLIDYLPELIKAGVTSFKIEGRAKSVYYLAVATRAYHQALNAISPSARGGDKRSAEGVGGVFRNQKIKKSKNYILDTQKQELLKIDNRGYTTGFLLGNEGLNREEFKTSKAVSDWEFVGEVVKTQKHKNTKTQKQISFIKPHNALKAGEKVEIITPEETYQVKFKEFFDKDGNGLAEVHGGTANIYRVELPSGYDIVEMSMIRKRKT